MLRQLSYAMKTQLKAPKAFTKDIACLSLCIYGIRAPWPIRAQSRRTSTNEIGPFCPKVTLQPEFPSNSADDIEEVEGCNLKCKHEECAEITCCNLEEEELPTVEESGGILYLSERPSVTEKRRASGGRESEWLRLTTPTTTISSLTFRNFLNKLFIY